MAAAAAAAALLLCLTAAEASLAIGGARRDRGPRRRLLQEGTGHRTVVPACANFSSAHETDLLRRFMAGIFELGYTCQHPVRLGKPNDGGYVACEDTLSGKPCELLSYGIANDDSLEMAVRKRYSCTIEEFDPTVGGSTGSQAYPGAVTFHKEGLAGSGPKVDPRLGNVDTLPHHAAKYLKPHRVFLLKVDVEESEWEAFNSVPESFLDTVDQLILEFHTTVSKSPQEVASTFASRVDVVEKLKRHFYLFHTHLNNYGGAASVPGVGLVPKAVELSFMRKGLVTPGPAPYDNHSELDQPCNAAQAELRPSYFGASR